MKPGDERVYLTVPEEETTTPANLFRIGLFAAFGFLAMAVVSQPETRGAPLFVGALIIGLLALVAGFLLWQRRYGESTLRATTSFTYGQRFEGWIETELTSVPAKPVVVKVEGQRGKSTVFIAREEVSWMQKDDGGHVRIPFAMQIPEAAEENRPAQVRVIVRTSTWPVGYGATFLL